MHITRRSLLAGSTAALSTLAITAPSLGAGSDRLAAARDIARGLMAADPIPGLSLAVMRGDELVWAEAFGKADLELDVSVTPAHRFRLGSVSKAITATLAAQLAARSVVDLDAPISRYLPELPEQHRTTTLEQLLTHRGGVRHYADKDRAGVGIDQRRYLSNADILAIFIDDPLIARPGERVSYSTFGYTLASLVLESAARTPFLELVQREIAEPLGLTTLGADDPTLVVPGRVSGYHPGDAIRRVFPAYPDPWANIEIANVNYKWAGGGLLASPVDLARFGAAHLAAGRLSKPAIDTLFRVRTERTERLPPMGLGWRVDEDGAGRLRWHHAGGQAGARASLVVYPRQRLSIAFATNSGLPDDVNGPSAKLADVFAA